MSQGQPPQRIQRKRTAGWRMPPNTISVTRPGKWGNPFTANEHGIEAALENFRYYATEQIELDPEWLAPLRGKDLACWCKEGAPCHADTLLKLANGGE